MRDEDGRFSFVHQSVLEWLVANAAAEEVKQGGLVRFEPGELDPYLPEPLRIPDDEPLLGPRALPDAGSGGPTGAGRPRG